MVKIIQGGIRTFIGDCPLCACRFSYEVPDLEEYSGLYYVRCPQCESRVEHNIENVLENSLADIILDN